MTGRGLSHIKTRLDRQSIISWHANRIVHYVTFGERRQEKERLRVWASLSPTQYQRGVVFQQHSFIQDNVPYARVSKSFLETNRTMDR